MGVLSKDTDDTAAEADTAEVVAQDVSVPRDERHDSLDPTTGTLSDEAVALRRAAQDAQTE